MVSVPAMVIAIVLGGLGMLGYVSKSRSCLQEWIAKNQYELVRAEYRPIFCRGPFMWSARGHAAYRVEVRDTEGAVREGWVRFGGWVLGVFSNQVKVTWDS